MLSHINQLKTQKQKNLMLISKYIDRFKIENREGKLIRVILLMTVIGSITGFENSQAYGCIYGLEMLSISNVLFATFSIVILVKIKNSGNQKLKQKLLLVELLVWIVKLQFYKGGYVTGFGGDPNIINISYDFAAIGLRTFLLLLLFDFKKIVIPLTLLVALTSSILKTKIFPLPAYTKFMWYLDDISAKKQRSQTIGDYQGEIYQFADSLTLPASITIDSTRMRFNTNTFKELAKSYYFYIDFPNNGALGTGTHSIYEVEIEKKNADSLILVLGEIYEPIFKLSLSKIER